MNKKEVEKIIDHFANKELSFGLLLNWEDEGECILLDHKMLKYGIGKRRHYKVWHIKEKYTSNYFNYAQFTVLGHPPMIGDVLKKMDESKEVHSAIELLKLWQPFGFTCSLNEIMEKTLEKIYITNCCKISGYILHEEDHECTHCGKLTKLSLHEEAIIDPKARALFEFLKPII